MKAANLVLAKALQARLEASGLDWVKLETLEFSRSERRVKVTVMLEGETQPITVSLLYSVDAAFTFLMVQEVQASRRWVTEAVRLFLANSGNRLPLPGGIKGVALKVIL